MISLHCLEYFSISTKACFDVFTHLSLSKLEFSTGGPWPTNNPQRIIWLGHDFNSNYLGQWFSKRAKIRKYRLRNKLISKKPRSSISIWNDNKRT